MDVYQSFIHKSRYARFLEDKGRREHWEETVDRYLSFMNEHLKKKHKYTLPTSLHKELRDAILNMEVMPSMRAMMTAGVALDRDNTAGYNCFGGTTKFMTKEGLRSFAETVGSTVNVWTPEGWQPATVRSFGLQSLNRVTFRPTKSKSSVRQTVETTGNHRWKTINRGWVTDLRVGDVIPSCVVNSHTHNNEAFIRGMGFGDGTIDARGRARIRLCGDKNSFMDTFTNYGHHVAYNTPSLGGDNLIVFDKDVMANWKQLPYEMLHDVDYLSSWLDGYLAADGHSNPVQPGLSSQNAEAISFVEMVAPLCGYIVTGKNVSSVTETNYGERSFPLIRLTLRKEAEFYVTNIEELEEQEVFCAVEPRTQSFSLAFGGLTGNCSYLPIDDPKAFDEAMFILMCGTGVGFSVERQYVNKLPEVPDDMFQSDTTIVVKDSKEGWSKALRQVIALLYSGEIPKWDLSKLRPAGAPLKTFGGRASGPAPLDDLFKFCVRVFSNAKGRRLTSLECHDIMCKIGEVVVVGGVRRSAMISLSNLSDDRMRHAKSGAWWEANVQRALSNNSAVYTERPEVGVFMQEWLSLYESKSGERGIFSRDASQRVAKKNGRRDHTHEFGTNPCCFTANMKLLTTDGFKTFKELEGKEFSIINAFGNVTTGKVWKVNRRKDVARITFFNQDADPIEATYDHVFRLSNGEECQVKDLIGKRPKRFVKMRTMPDPYQSEEFQAGFMLGGGILTDLLDETKKGMSVCIGAKDHDVLKYFGGQTPDMLDKNGHLYTQNNAYVARKFALPAKKIGSRGLPESVRTKNGLMGLFSANGSVIKQSRVALKTTDLEQATELIHTLADMFGIQAYVTTNKAHENEFSNGTYAMQESYDVNIGRYMDIIKFAEEIGFVQKYKQDALQNMIDARAPMVKSLESIGEMDVYDFNEPETNWGIVNGCVVHNSEIILRPYQFCNLTEAVVRATDTEKDLARKVRLAAILGTIQSTLTHFPYLRKIWQKNTEEERLLGVSLTGIYDSKLLNDPNDTELAERLEKLRYIAVDANKEYAEAFGIPQSTAVTCVKPSGTVSQLVDAASGIHPRHDPYYFRRVRSDNKDPLTKFLVDAGIMSEPDVTKVESTTVFTFPKKAPEGAVMRSDISAIDHLNLWLTFQRHWCEHKPSVTISVLEKDWPTVGAWVWEHFDEISGVSFLPFDGGTYRQAPYETVTKEQYEELLNKTPDTINWENFKEIEDNVEGVQTLACTAASCEI